MDSSKGETKDGTIEELHYDMIEPIFIHLKEDDLCAVSQTCQRLNVVARIHFFLKHKGKFSVVTKLSNGNKDVPNFMRGLVEIKKYREFRDIIPKIWLKAPEHESRRDDSALIDYMVYAGCHQHPNFIRLENMTLGKAESVGMLGALNTVETIEFINCTFENIYDDFLSRCHGMKSLTLRECTFQSDEPFWLQHYPELVTIDITLKKSNHKMLIDFFKMNHHIKRFFCKSHLSSENSSILNVMKAIDNEQLVLTELHLTIGGTCVFEPIYTSLVALTRQSTFSRLSLEFHENTAVNIFMNNLNNLMNINKLYALHIKPFDIEKDFPRNINSFHSLRVLHLTLYRNCEYSADFFASITPNLEELVVRRIICYKLGVDDFIQPFAAKSLKLRKIVLASQASYNFDQHLVELNETRKNLRDASSITIWTPPSRTKLPKIEGVQRIHVETMYDEYEHIPDS